MKTKKLSLVALVLGLCVALGLATSGGSAPAAGAAPASAPGVLGDWVARYDAANSSDGAEALAVDASGNVYVTGWSYAGAPTGYDYATIKYLPDGSVAPGWPQRYDAANLGDWVYALAVDALGNVYVTGDSDGGAPTGDDYATIKYEAPPHYACYLTVAGLDPPDVVTLNTQFGFEADVEVEAASWLCAPAIKNGVGDPDATHLRAFAIDEPAPNKLVDIITTQSGTFDNVELGNAVWLLAPTSKEVVDPPGGSYPSTEEPHYKCYDAFTTHGIESVDVVDQFYPAGIGWYVADLQTLCVPTGKNGAPIPEAPDLACFMAARDAPTTYTVDLETQFGPETDVTLAPLVASQLCVPATTEVVEPHYDCRVAEGSLDPPDVVRLQTQFGVEEDVDPGVGDVLCAPALKNGQGDLNAAHLRSFRIWDEPPLEPPRVVNLTTQFGELKNVGVWEPYWLLTPASKTEAGIEPPPYPAEPHYKCYLIDGPDANQAVLVESQFTAAGGEPITVGFPSLLCLPAGKNGAPIPDAPDLVCYAMAPPPLGLLYWVLTQFGFEELLVGVESAGVLCVPAEMELVCPEAIGNGCSIPGWDVTDPAMAADCDNDGLSDADELTGAACSGYVTDPGWDITYDDGNNGIMLDGSDDAASWDTDGDCKRDGAECTLGTDPTNPASQPSVAQCGGTGDTDGDGLLDSWEVCKWGTCPDGWTVIGTVDCTVVADPKDTDGDGTGDCVEAADVNGDGIVDFVGDTLWYARAALLPAGCGAGEFGKDGDFDLDGSCTIDFVGDVIQVAKFALIPGLCQ